MMVFLNQRGFCGVLFCCGMKLNQCGFKMELFKIIDFLGIGQDSICFFVIINDFSVVFGQEMVCVLFLCSYVIGFFVLVLWQGK